MISQRVDEYKNNFSELKNALKWKVSDKRILMMIASMYVTNGKPFNKERFLQISEYISKEVGLFSTLKTSHRFTTAALLDVRFEYPEEQFSYLLQYYNLLVNGGFGRGIFTYISAYVLLTNQNQEELTEDTIQKAMTIYKGMRKNHPFLTSSSDYPLSILLANTDETVEATLDRVETFYTKLDQKGFRKGNELQFLSHFLSFKKEEDKDEIVDRCTELFEAFERLERKPKVQHYSSLGILSLTNEGKNEVEPIIDLYQHLNSEKDFKWHKDANFTMAVNLAISEKFKDSSLMDTGVYTSLEAIIQAQQVAMVAAVAGAAATSSGDGG